MNNLENKNVFLYNQRVHWADTDASGRIHYTAVLRYFEIAEAAFFRTNAITYKSLKEQGIDLPRVHVECDYKIPIQHDNLLQIRTSIEKLGNKSITLQFNVHFENNELAAKGRVIICAIDMQTGRSTTLPIIIKSLEK